MTNDQGQRWRLRLIEAAILLAFAVMIWLGLGMHRGLLLSSDIKNIVYPWAGTTTSRTSQATVLADPVQQFVPWHQFARRELGLGRLPLWNPHQDGGVPLLGNPQSALASPFSLPPLFIGIEAGWNFGLMLRILVGFGGAYLWLRSLNHERMSSALGGVMFALSGAFVAWLEHPHTGSVAWAPWLLLAISKLAASPRPAHWCGVAFTTFLVIAGGHPETVLMVALLATAVLAFRVPSWPARRRVVTSALLGAGLAAPLLAPAIEYLQLSSAVAGDGRSQLVLEPAALLRFILPRAAISHPIEAAATVSLVGLVLALIGSLYLRKSRESRFWGILTLAFLIIAYDNPMSHLIARITPIYWTRILLLLPLPLAILAATGLERITAWLEGTRRPRLALSFSIAATIIAASELMYAARGVHAITSPHLMSATTPLLEFLAKDPEPFRIAPLGEFLPPNLATVAGLDDIRGYDALAPRGWRQRREEIGVFVKEELHPGSILSQGFGLDFWNVKYLLISPQHKLTAKELSQSLMLDLEEVYSGVDGKVWRNRRCLPRLRLNGPGSILLINRKPTRWHFQVANPLSTNLVIANPYFPGWFVRVDGRTQAHAFTPGEAITLPLETGPHQVELFYRPKSVRLGVFLAIVAAMWLGLACWKTHNTIAQEQFIDFEDQDAPHPEDDPVPTTSEAATLPEGQADRDRDQSQ